MRRDRSVDARFERLPLGALLEKSQDVLKDELSSGSVAPSSEHPGSWNQASMTPSLIYARERQKRRQKERLSFFTSIPLCRVTSAEPADAHSAMERLGGARDDKPAHNIETPSDRLVGGLFDRDWSRFTPFPAYFPDEEEEARLMSTMMQIALGASIALIGLLLFVSLSSAAATVLLRIWLVCSPLVLMARLNETRRGVHSGYGGLPLCVVGRLALQSLVTGFFLASALVLGAFAALSVLP